MVLRISCVLLVTIDVVIYNEIAIQSLVRVGVQDGRAPYSFSTNASGIGTLVTSQATAPST